ncbi:unnamed protein product [Cuscuta epithymum]|uniref:Uncharacterized protein n=1 Tax=Cuscuta epithymum TaxID=186058 RepID=A0AAV0FMQ8_9ASTE|nr:unnamed protein product [Cuscuta epithymum]
MSTSNLLLSNPFPTSLWGDKTTIKGLKYTWSKSEISVDVNTWIYPRVDIPEFPLTELSGLVQKVVKEGSSFKSIVQIARAVASTALTENDYISAVSVSVKVDNPEEALADSTDSWAGEAFRFKGN